MAFIHGKLTWEDAIIGISNSFQIKEYSIRNLLEKEYPKTYFPILTLKEYSLFISKYKQVLLKENNMDKSTIVNFVCVNASINLFAKKKQYTIIFPPFHSGKTFSSNDIGDLADRIFSYVKTKEGRELFELSNVDFTCYEEGNYNTEDFEEELRED